MSLRTVARVKLTVEFEVPDTWTDTCQVVQINEQARESALACARRGLAINSMISGVDKKTPARVIGEPEVTVILIEDKP